MDIVHYQITPSTLIKAGLTWGADHGGYLEVLSARAGVEHTVSPRDAVAEHKDSFLGIPYTVSAKPAVYGHQTTFYGARAGLSNTDMEDIVGLDLGVIYTQADKVTGLQLGGLFAIANNVNGIQFGTLYNNVIESITGLKLGLISWVQTSMGILGGIHLPNFVMGMYFKNADRAFR